jgi:hypothetical protein
VVASRWAGRGTGGRSAAKPQPKRIENGTWRMERAACKYSPQPANNFDYSSAEAKREERGLQNGVAVGVRNACIQSGHRADTEKIHSRIPRVVVFATAPAFSSPARRAACCTAIRLGQLNRNSTYQSLAALCQSSEAAKACRLLAFDLRLASLGPDPSCPPPRLTLSSLTVSALQLVSVFGPLRRPRSRLVHLNVQGYSLRDVLPGNPARSAEVARVA